MTYLSGIVFTLIFAKVISDKKVFWEKNNQIALIILEIICMLPMFIISALRRYEVGTDLLYVYIRGFIRVSNNIDTDNFEWGFKTLLQVLGKITNNPQIMVIVTSFLFILFTWLAIYKESVNIPFSLLILFISRYYFISLNVIRQFIGLALILFALQFIVKKQYTKYIIFNIIASSFHSSLILCLVFVLFDKFKLNSKKIIVSLIVSILIISLLGQTTLISNIISNIASTFDKYSMYIGANAVSGAYFAENRFRIIQIILNVFILGIMMGVYERLKRNSYYNLFLWIQLIAVLICFLMSSAPLMERVFWIFGFPQIISIPQSIHAYSNKYLKVLLSLLIIGLMGTFCIYDIFILHDHQVVPYYSIFSNSL